MTAAERAREKAKLRFWAKVHIEGDCWPWLGATDQRYGQFFYRRRSYKAHRFAYEITFGPIPTGLLVCHHCDNPICVNPAHLFLGSQSDNMIDCSRKGRIGAYTHPESLPRGERNGRRLHPERTARGERQGSAKLTEDAVREIRRLIQIGWTQRAIAHHFGVGKSTIAFIAKRQRWQHVL